MADILGYARVSTGGSNYNSGWGFIDKTGKVVVELIYTDARDFADNGLAAIRVGEVYNNNVKWGFVNTKGEIVIEPQYLSTWDFSQG